jgi:hypothetical protein
MAADPLTVLRNEIATIAEDPGLDAGERAAAYRALRRRMQDALGELETYAGDADLARTAHARAVASEVARVRENADIREELIRRGAATAEDMDAIGYLAHDEIDRLLQEGLLEEAVAYQEKQHPRDRTGKWRRKPGGALIKQLRARGGGVLPEGEEEAPGKATAPTPATEEEPVDVGGDIELAARLLSEGKKVKLAQPREVSVLLDKLAMIALDAEAKGEQAPTYDLCGIHVEGTNLFCVESKGIPRVRMPQLVGDPAPGTKADKLQRNKRGEVDITRQFRAYLKSEGVKMRMGEEEAQYLRASQNELNGVKTAGIMGALEKGVKIEGRLFVSRDNYIVDGHHRWAAEVGRDLRDNIAGDVTMQIERIDMDIVDLLDLANAFAADWGLQQQAVGESAGTAARQAKPRRKKGARGR